MAKTKAGLLLLVRDRFAFKLEGCQSGYRSSLLNCGRESGPKVRILHPPRLLTTIKHKQMKDETLFFHGTSIDGRRFTLAAKFLVEVDDLLLGIAICSTTDQFVKKIGRKKAEGRLLSESFKGCHVIGLYSGKDFDHDGTGFKQDWFIGKEIEIFLEKCAKFELMTFKELKYDFNLDF